MNRYGPNRDERLSGRDHVLAERVINTIKDIHRISAGSLDNLQDEMALARYPVSPDKIRKLPYSALRPLHTLVVGFYTKLMGALNPVINTSYRVETADDADTPYANLFAWTLKNPVTKEIQTGVIGEDAAGNLDVAVYHNDNKSGAVDNADQAVADASWTAGVVPHLTKVSDEVMFLRHFDLNTEDDIFRYTLDAAGDLVKTVEATITPTSVGHVNNPVIRDFSDGVNFWFFEANDGGNQLVIRKLNIETGVVTAQVLDEVDISAEKFFHAYGDTWFLVCTSTGGRRYIFGTLEDAATPAAIDVAATGTAYETAGNDALLGTIGAAENIGREVTLFSTAAGTDVHAAIHTSKVDMNEQTIDTTQILGKSVGWPVDVGIEATYVFDSFTQRIAQVITSEDLGTQMFLYTISPARQVSALFPLPLRNVTPTEGVPNTFPSEAMHMPLVSVDEAPLVGVFQDGADDFHLLELSA